MSDDFTVRHAFTCADLPWRVRQVALEERIGAPYLASLRLVCEQPVASAKVLGAPAKLTWSQADAERSFAGLVTRFEPLGNASGLTHVRVRLEPRVALLRRRRRFRIFQDLTVAEIVGAVLDELGGVTVVQRLQRTPLPRSYCVQHGESDLDFLSRLLEDEGITWLGESREDGEDFVLVDHNDALVGIEPDANVPVTAGLPGRRTPGVTHLLTSHRLPAPGVVERDWDWQASPPAVHESVVAVEGIAADPDAQWEVFDARLDAAADGPRHAQDEAELLAQDDTCGRGESDVIGFCPGRRVELALDDGESTMSLLLVAVRHRAELPDTDQVAGGSRGQDYGNGFECQPLGLPLRPPRLTPRPRISGMHTAVVTGPDGEEIHTDALGRIRVRMHWDRSDSDGGSASCWIRVAQPWAGAGWGASFIPRVGMEVLIAFVDGDPDRPVCVGCLYNGGNPTPQTLPDERTRAVLRTRSTPGGNGFNELSFEDAAGGEQVYLHAQRNLDVQVRNNATQRVGVDELEHVGRDRTTTIARHEGLAVDGDRMRTVGGNEGISVSGSQHVVVLGGPGKGSDTGAPPVPGADLFVHGRYELWARDEIVVHCGPSSITLGPAGIQITAPMITVTGGGSQLALSPGLATTSAPAIALAGAKAGLQIDDVAKLTSDVQVRVQVGDSRLTLDGTARLRAPSTTIEGASSLALTGDAGIDIAARAITVTGDAEVSITSPAQVSVDGGGGTAVFAAGTVQICE